jgi:hypothetical protein
LAPRARYVPDQIQARSAAPGSNVLKTTYGKVRRLAAAEQFLSQRRP